MALTKIVLRNFKSIGDEPQIIEFAPYTLLFGPNSAGKSTLIQALIFVHEILINGSRDVHKTELGGGSIDLGGFMNAVNGRDCFKDISIELECTISQDDLVSWIDPNKSWREDIPWPYFFDGPRLRHSGGVSRAAIGLVIGLSGEGTSDVIIKKFRSGFNGTWMSAIEASATGKQISVICEEVSELYQMFDGDSLNLPEAHNWEFSRSDWFEAEWGSYEEHGPDSAEWHHAEESFKPWTLNQIDALPKGGRNADASLGFAADDQIRYLESGDGFDGKNLNELKLLEALTVVPLEAVQRELEELLYIGPLRNIPTRESLSGLTDPGSGWWDGSAAWSFPPDHKFPPNSSGANMNKWLGQNYLDTGYQIKTKTVSEIPEDHPIWRLSADDLDDGLFEQFIGDLRTMPSRTRVFLEDEDTGLELSAKDVGAGISQIFPVVAASSITWHGLIAVEQPELHVHPALQTNLADVFIESHFVQHNMFLLETHSEHLMLRFLRRVEETQSSPETKIFEDDRLTGTQELEDGGEFYFEAVPGLEEKKPCVNASDLAIYYLEPGEKGTRFHKIEVSDDGDFTTTWPRGFFTEREEELFG